MAVIALWFLNMVVVAAGLFPILGSGSVAGSIELGDGDGKAMVYFCTVGSEAWIAYLSGSGLTNCEWLIPGSGGIDG
jgi:hypothetical protein